MSEPKAIVIASAARTAVGAFNGAFATIPAHELGATVIKGALERAGVDATDVDEVILGQVLTAGEGRFPSISSAAPACGRLRSACSRFFPAMRKSSWRAVRSPCRWRRIARICVRA